MELCLWGIGLWVTILVSSQLRYSIDHRGESLTVPHPRRVSTPLMAAMVALPCRSSDKSMAAQAREFGTSPRPSNLGRVPPGLCREFGKLTLTLPGPCLWRRFRTLSLRYWPFYHWRRFSHLSMAPSLSRVRLLTFGGGLGLYPYEIGPFTVGGGYSTLPDADKRLR